jgi:hypothetical protein
MWSKTANEATDEVAAVTAEPQKVGRQIHEEGASPVPKSR